MVFYYVFLSLISIASSQHATLCDEARLYTFIPDVRDCSAWFFCAENGPVRGVCPKDLLFNPETKLCDWPEYVDCFRCPSNVGFHKTPMNGSCRSFIRCISGIPFQSICEDGLQFNENTGQCDLSDVVNCDSGFRCPAKLPDDGSIIAMRDNYNCSVYHLCIGETEAVRQECNPQLHFDSATNLCTFPNLTFCPITQHPDGPGIGPGGPELETTIKPITTSTSISSATTTTTTTTECIPTEETTKSPTEPSSTKPSPNETSPTEPSSIQESPTEPSPTEPSPTETSPTESSPTETSPTEPSPTESSPTKASSTESTFTTTEFECTFDGIHPHPNECTEYFICAANIPHLMRCAENLYFNSATLQCDFPENAECDLYSNFI